MLSHIEIESGKEVIKMPLLDGTGPMGQGPMTGRGLGNCTGRGFNPWPMPGGYGRGFGTGMGMGRGFGRGRGRGIGMGLGMGMRQPRRSDLW